MKKLLAAILTVVMLLTAVPISAFAVDEQAENGGVSTESYAKGANSVGNVLADVIEEAQNDEAAKAESPAGFSALSVDGFTATVNFETDVNAKLVVAIYTEDGKQMLTSGMTDVTTEDTTATVEITKVALPQYYLAKAFLLDAKTNASLCGYFSDDTHTKAYIDFMALDVNDFDEDKVINLDENEENNFLVVSGDADIIEGTNSVNTLSSADYDTSTYVFDNINADIKALQVGDIFYYQSASGEYELIKVKSISINGSTATVVGDDMDTDEAFECVKIDTADFQDEEESYSTKSLKKSKSTEIDDSVNFFHGSFDVEWKKQKDGRIKAQVSRTVEKGNRVDDKTDDETAVEGTTIVSLNADVKLGADIKIFLNNSYKKVEFVVGVTAGITLNIQAEFKKDIPLGKFEFTFFKILNVGAKITFKIEASVKLEVSGTFICNAGFKWQKVEGFEKVFNKPSFKPEVKVEGTFYIGFELKPYLSLISEHVVSAEFPLNLGGRITASTSLSDTLSDKHDCALCIAGDIKIEFTAKAELWLAKKTWDFLERHYQSGELKVTKKIADFYFSVSHGQFGWGLCPYIKADDDPSTGTGGLSGSEKVGDIIEFGSYPQSRVTNDTLIDGLNGQSLSWKSYGYYSGNGNYGSMVQGDYMKYADVVFNNNKYRAVKFTQYRPYWTESTSSASHTYQDDNGYNTNTVYWFKYEPLKWRVLDPSNGLVLSETCIDSQAYSNTIYYYNGYYYNDETHTNYASDYKTSTIREWLNNDFYNTAFNSTQQGKIVKTKLDNSSPYNNNQYGSESTTDKVFLMSYNEMLNSSYGFSTSYSTYDVARRAKSTDYAKAQGCWQNTSSSYQGNAFWFLRSPGYGSSRAWDVLSDGSVYGHCNVIGTDLGVRPALRLNLTSKISTSSVESENFAVDEPQEAVAPKKSITRAAVAAGTIFDFSYSACTAGSNYVLLNVTGYGDNFELTNNNLQYIDVLTADENGKITASFEPKTKSANSTTLLIGDFGNGIEAKVITKENTQLDKVTKVSFSGDVEMNYNRFESNSAIIETQGNPEYTVEYSSSNPDVVSVEKETGLLMGLGKGTATITVTVTDSNGNVVTDTCNVKVKFTFWQWLLYIICFGWIWM